MKKRLRKKLRLKEFQELGFHASFDLAPAQDDLTFFDQLIPFVESIGLFIGGGINNFYAVAGHRQSATPEQQQALREWLTQHPQVSNIDIGPLNDAWHSTDYD
ncbi:50S ribosome-binding protein YggL [Hymenobacter coalescens]